MNESRGLILAELSAAQTEPEPVSQDILSRINERIKPLSPVSEAGVYVRSMYIVSDEVNSYGGRFPSEEFPRLIELLIDSPVLIGHRKDSLPIGRTFHARPVERDGRLWIKSSFYWLRNGDEAERLRENIDGGIYKECSIGFTFLTPECSICGEDIRQCRHLPLETYIINGQEQHCHFNYRRIQKVLETSLVYRGATPDTSISRELAITKSIDDESEAAEPLGSPDELAECASYTIIPSYDGIDLAFRLTGGTAVAWRSDGRRVDLGMFGRLKSDGRSDAIMKARLVGFRGKARCTRAELERYLRNESGPVSRLVLYIYPIAGSASSVAGGSSRHRVQPIRFRQVPRSEIIPAARMLTTKRGVEILCPSEPHGEIRAFLYQPNEKTCNVDTDHERVSFSVGSDSALLHVGGNPGGEFTIRRFNLRSFAQGRRFLADRIERGQVDSTESDVDLFDGVASRVRTVGKALLIETANRRLGAVALRPVNLGGQKRFMCYRLPVTADDKGRSGDAV